MGDIIPDSGHTALMNGEKLMRSQYAARTFVDDVVTVVTGARGVAPGQSSDKIAVAAG